MVRNLPVSLVSGPLVRKNIVLVQCEAKGSEAAVDRFSVILILIPIFREHSTGDINCYAAISFFYDTITFTIR